MQENLVVKKATPLGARVWTSLLVFGFIGQIAWMVENVYFSTYIQKNITAAGWATSATVAASAIAAALVGELQSIVSREIDPQEPCVITVGSFHCGTTWNIIADSATLVGTTRCFSKEVNDFLPEAMERVVKNVCAAHRCEGELTYTRIVPPTVNDPAAAEIAKGAVEKIYGKGAAVTMKPTAGGEDFSLYIQDVPGAIAMIGIYNPDIDAVYANHHGKFKVDEEQMVKGAGLLVQMAVDYLNA